MSPSIPAAPPRLPALPLRCRFGSGRRSKFPYHVGIFVRSLIPASVSRRRLPALLASIDKRPDASLIRERAAYYCALAPNSVPLPSDSIRIADQLRPSRSLVYYYDSRALLRYFPPDLRFFLLPGDARPAVAPGTLAKARPLAPEGRPDNSAWVLLPLNQIRHLNFIRDPFPHDAKAPLAVFRGKVKGSTWNNYKPGREIFFHALHGRPRYDLGDTVSKPAEPSWAAPPLSIWQQLRYRYVFSIEGNDVATSLKWILSSNSLAVTPPLTHETWFQEGLLRPHVHFIPVAPDYSDTDSVLDWYDAHPDARAAILRNAHEWVARFLDLHRELLVALLTLSRYFAATGQTLDF